MDFLRFFFNKNRSKLIPLLLFAAILAAAFYSVEDATSSSERLQYDMTLRAISRALADCYAIEGHYPPNIEYLYENYRVRVDENKYFVIYEVFAPNISPTVKLIDRRSPVYG